jgi:hypothetical protein
MDWQQTLIELRKELSTHAGYPCISLTVPTGRNMPDNAADPIRVKNLVSEAASRLEEEIGKRPAAAALKNLQTAADSVDHDLNLDGLAIFANENIEIVLKTRFPLPERLVIDERFSLRALLRAERRAEPFTVVVLSLDEARVFTGVREDLFEVRGEGLPAKNSGVGAGAKVPSGPGVNATAAVDDSRSQFVRHVMNQLGEHADLPTRLVVAGTPEVLADAEQQVSAPFEIIATLAGNYIGDNVSELGTRAWEAVREARQAMAHGLLDQLDAARSAQKCEVGIQALAPLAAQGRIDTLICGFDVEAPGRYDPETGLFTEIEAVESWTDLDDGVEWLIHQVLDHGGSVRFAEDELLGDQPLAAILRY